MIGISIMVSAFLWGSALNALPLLIIISILFTLQTYLKMLNPDRLF